MPGKVQFLLEEPSMERFLQTVMPKIKSDWRKNQDYSLHPHQGVNELQKSIPKKLEAFKNTDTIFVIVLDQDNHDCCVLKDNIKRICAWYVGRCRIRIVCRNLEAWHLWDLNAVKSAYPSIQNISKIPNPDSLTFPTKKLNSIVPRNAQNKKLEWAERIGKHISIHDNKSVSFQFFRTLVEVL